MHVFPPNFLEIDLVWLNKASIPNISFLGSLEVGQNFFPRGWVGGEAAAYNEYTDYNANLSSNWT